MSKYAKARAAQAAAKQKKEETVMPANGSAERPFVNGSYAEFYAFLEFHFFDENAPISSIITIDEFIEYHGDQTSDEVKAELEPQMEALREATAITTENYSCTLDTLVDEFIEIVKNQGGIVPQEESEEPEAQEEPTGLDKLSMTRTVNGEAKETKKDSAKAETKPYKKEYYQELLNEIKGEGSSATKKRLKNLCKVNQWNANFDLLNRYLKIELDQIPTEGSHRNMVRKMRSFENAALEAIEKMEAANQKTTEKKVVSTTPKEQATPKATSTKKGEPSTAVKAHMDKQAEVLDTTWGELIEYMLTAKSESKTYRKIVEILDRTPMKVGHFLTNDQGAMEMACERISEELARVEEA